MSTAHTNTLPTYRIKNWDKLFENNRTRSLKRMDWIPIPNKMDGDGYTDLLDHPNGAAHLGAWVAILQIASRCDMRGTLCRLTSAGITPHDFKSFARISRISASVFAEAIPRLQEIGWIEAVSDCSDGKTQSPPNVSEEIPHLDAGKPHDDAPSPHPDAEEQVCQAHHADYAHARTLPFPSIPFPSILEKEVQEEKQKSRSPAVIIPDRFQDFIGMFIAAGKAMNEIDIGNALKVWLNSDPPEHEVICADVARKLQDGTWSDAQHTPMPRRYLENKEWTRKSAGRILPTVVPKSRTQANHEKAAAEFIAEERRAGR